MKKFKLLFIILFATLSFAYSPLESNAEPMDDSNKSNKEIENVKTNDEDIRNNLRFSFSDHKFIIPGYNNLNSNMLIPDNSDIDPKMLIPGNPDIDTKMLIPGNSDIDPKMLIGIGSKK